MSVTTVVEKDRTPNVEAIREWVAALRSDAYQQGRNRLITDEGGEKTYCCLGVACDLFAERVGVTLEVSEERRLAGFTPYRKYTYSWTLEGDPHPRRTTTALPVPVTLYLGVESMDPRVASCTETDGDPVSLSCLNDIYQATFEQIADAIEATYLKEETNV